LNVSVDPAAPQSTPRGRRARPGTTSTGLKPLSGEYARPPVARAGVGEAAGRPTVPVQVLVPRRDVFVSPALQRFHRRNSGRLQGSVTIGRRALGGSSSRPDGHRPVDRRVGRSRSSRVNSNAGVSVVSEGPRRTCVAKLALVTGSGAGIRPGHRGGGWPRQGRHARCVIVDSRPWPAAKEAADCPFAPACADAAVYEADVQRREGR